MIFFFLVSLCYWLLFLLSHFLFCLSRSSLFSSGQVWLKVYQVCLLKKKKLLLSLIFDLCFISCVIFIVSFLLLTFYFIFLNTFRWQVRLFILIFSCFLRNACITRNIPLRNAFASSHGFLENCVSFPFEEAVISFSFTNCCRESPSQSSWSRDPWYPSLQNPWVIQSACFWDLHVSLYSGPAVELCGLIIKSFCFFSLSLAIRPCQFPQYMWHDKISPLK